MAKIIHIYNKQTSFLSKENEIEFLLYHLAKENENYIDFFRKINKYKIFDNSFYELRKEIDYDDYFNYAEMLNVDEIILPDKLWDGEWTRQKVREILDEYYDYIKSKDWKIAAVIQGKDVGDIMQSFLTFLQDDRIDVIMIPRKVLHRSKWIELSAKNYSEARIKIWEQMQKAVAKNIIEEKIGAGNVLLKSVHFLGANSLWEILYVKHQPTIRSIDTKWFSKMLVGKWEKWDERYQLPEEILEELWEKGKIVLEYDEKYGVV